MPRGVDTGTSPGRRVGRDRFDNAVYTTMNRRGGSFDTGRGPRPAFTLREGRELGHGAVVSGGPAGRITRRGPRFAGRD